MSYISVPIRNGLQDILLILSYQKKKCKVSGYATMLYVRKKPNYIFTSIYLFPLGNIYQTICMPTSDYFMHMYTQKELRLLYMYNYVEVCKPYHDQIT